MGACAITLRQFGDCDGAMPVLVRTSGPGAGSDLSRYVATGVRRYFRADASPSRTSMSTWRSGEYAIRLPSNKVCNTAPLLKRPVGRRSVILYDDFWYRAGSWDRARRVVAKVEWHRGELFPRVGFIVTMTAGPEGVVRLPSSGSRRASTLNWTRLSCHRFVANRVRLSLFVSGVHLGTSFAGCVCPRRSSTGRGACRSS